MNIIWIISDTFRQDHLGCYGNEWIQTPAIDVLAAKSVRFDRHYAADFPTMPCRADFLTGRWTGCFMQWEPLSRNLILLPQLLSANRILTTAVVDTPFYLRNGMGYDRGFKGFIEIRGQQYGLPLLKDVRPTWRFESDRFAPRTFTRAMEWLDMYYREQPFFLYIDVWDPHEPWDAPVYYTERYWPGYDGEQVDAPYAYWQDVPGLTEEKVKKAHAAYCGECTMVDTWLGFFLRKCENMGLLDNTAIIFTTDHGFYFGEHGGLFGKMTRAFPGPVPFWNEPDPIKQAWTHSPLYEECVLCPLLIYLPGNKPGVYRGLTSAVDLMPTVLDIFGLQIPGTVEGESLLPKLSDLGSPGRPFTLSTHPFAKPHMAIRSVDGEERQLLVDSDSTITTDEWSLLFNTEPGRSMLFHLPTDPRQEKNIIQERPEVAGELHQMLIKFMNDYKLASELRDPRLKLIL